MKGNTAVHIGMKMYAKLNSCEMSLQYNYAMSCLRHISHMTKYQRSMHKGLSLQCPVGCNELPCPNTFRKASVGKERPCHKNGNRISVPGHLRLNSSRWEVPILALLFCLHLFWLQFLNLDPNMRGSLWQRSLWISNIANRQYAG